MNKIDACKINSDEMQLFRNYLQKISGVCVSPVKSYLFETRLALMMAEAGANSYGEFYDYVMSGADPDIDRKIIDAMTTNETLWFRDGAPWTVMGGLLLPALVGALRSGAKSRVRIWCAAVSTGQEVYSTVMCIDEYLTKNRVTDVRLSDFEFLATDISTRALGIAERGRYDRISITRGLDGACRDRYFDSDGQAWTVSAKIRKAVKFAQFNLQHSFAGLGSFDVIFCRYVLIYFSDDLKREIISKMHSALLGGGVLFTGNYALYDMFGDGFTANHYENLTYYTRD